MIDVNDSLGEIERRNHVLRIVAVVFMAVALLMLSAVLVYEVIQTERTNDIVNNLHSLTERQTDEIGKLRQENRGLVAQVKALGGEPVETNIPPTLPTVTTENGERTVYIPVPGPAGPQGPPGPTGPKGDKGDKGDQGESGRIVPAPLTNR